MRRCIASFALALAVTASYAQSGSHTWRAKLAEQMQLLGHRNWIVVADSAYPWQVSPGVETVETGADHVEVLKAVLKAIKGSIHVRPIIYMDSELRYVPESDAPGVDRVRKALNRALAGREIQTMLHEKIIGKLDETGKTFHVLLLKTNMAVPYTSVFLQLNCKYWGDDAEKRLRQRMKS